MKSILLKVQKCKQFLAFKHLLARLLQHVSVDDDELKLTTHHPFWVISVITYESIKGRKISTFQYFSFLEKLKFHVQCS